jgi:hypothetical protein
MVEAHLVMQCLCGLVQQNRDTCFSLHVDALAFSRLILPFAAMFEKAFSLYKK